MTAEVRGPWRPTWVALWRVLRSQVRARGSDPAFTDDAGTLTRRELWRAIRRRRRELRSGSRSAPAVVLSSDEARTVVIDALGGLLARRTVVVVPPRAGERALREARAARSGGAGVFFTTSGTTGGARVVRSRRGVRAMGQVVGLLGMLPRFRRPVVVSLAPVSHGHGFTTFLVTMALGGHFVAPGRQAADRLRGFGFVDVLTGVPLQLEELAGTLTRHSAPVPRFGLVLSGSDRLTGPARLSAAFGARVVDAYGTTETGTLTLDGLPLPGVRIRADQGRLLVRSPMLGPGFFDSDRGFIRDGRVHVTGRADGVRVSAGENTSPEVVRRWLLAQPGVSAVRLEDRGDERFGTRPVAVVTAAGHVDGRQLREAIRREFGNAATPAAVEVTTAGRP
ncbi:hypothetical protein GCM10028820_22820 [Tessaracoccus terricola]